MALIKRGKTWHCHFVVNGQRFRQSLETTDWREAQSKEKDKIADAREGKLTQTSSSLARQPFEKAADDYVTSRKLELATASQAKEKQLLVQWRAFFKRGPISRADISTHFQMTSPGARRSSGSETAATASLHLLVA